MWRNHGGFEVEETKIVHANVLTFQLVVGAVRFYVVGCYIPPSNALAQRPKGCKPLLIGDLNIDLEYPRDERDDEVAEECDANNLVCMSRHFRQQRRRHVRGRWTWRQRRLGRWIASKPDYFLARERDRGHFERVGL